jgi:hypothetical protein
MLSGKPLRENEPTWIKRLKLDLPCFPFHERSEIPNPQAFKATSEQFVGRQPATAFPEADNDFYGAISLRYLRQGLTTCDDPIGRHFNLRSIARDEPHTADAAASLGHFDPSRQRPSAKDQDWLSKEADLGDPDKHPSADEQAEPADG